MRIVTVPEENTTSLTIDVISDVICPWCYVGKRRMEKAIAQFGHRDLRVKWHPFQLNPRMPRGGIDRKEYRAAKFGSWERSLALDARLTSVGNEEAIPFAFERIERTPNTLDAHRLIWLADQLGVQDAVVETIFRAYFTEGTDLTDVPTLIEITAKAGLDRDRAHALLGGDEGMIEIQAAEDDSRRLGVDAVPYFSINSTVSFGGAIEVSEFINILSLAHDNIITNIAVDACKLGPAAEQDC
jgi:predicted DsbA family dithiol-disulfide isomerase